MNSTNNRHYTVMIIPEKSDPVRKILIPSWMIKLGGLILGVVIVLIGLMISNYGYVMGQITENNELKTENRRLRQQVQVFKSKMNSLDNTMDRLKTLSTRLKIITGAEDRGGPQALQQNLPDASTNLGIPKAIPAEVIALGAELNTKDPERIELQKQYIELEGQIVSATAEALAIEQSLQSQYDGLVEQKAFLAALPTRRPAVGYFTSGFGIRRAPMGGKIKMHEGLDIANHPGTPIRATADGVISFASAKAGYGQTVIIDHGYGLETWYAHTQRILVRSNQRIKRGEAIALLGSTGRSTGPHLHYEVRVNGTPVDPLSYIIEN